MKRRWANLGLPLLTKELAEMAQLRRTYVVRVAFASLMFLTSALVFLPTYQVWSKLPRGIFGHGAEFFDVLFAIEWAGLVLFVPAVVSGALTAEKERNTLQLLFLTKLGPWTILLEKLLSRLVPVATFLLVSLPLLFIAYLWGGLTQSDVGLAIAELALVVFELASIALFCSAFCATSASAFILSYVITALVFLCPFLIVLTLLFVNWWSRLMGAGDLTLVVLANAPQHRDTVLMFMTSTLGINLAWLFDQRFAPGVVRPFHTVLLPFVIIPIVGVIFLLVARRAVVSRAAPQPKHRIRRLFAWLDRLFTRLNDRYAKGILLTPPDSGVPDGNPIAWRERRRGNLGRMNYLIRVLVLLESPILFFSVISAVGFNHQADFDNLGLAGLFLWPIALLIVIVRASGLIAAEKARQTLDVLLTTPLSLSELLGAKLRGLRRVEAVLAVPIVFQTLLIAYLRLAVARPHFWMEHRQILANAGEAVYYVFLIGLNLVILFGLAAQLAFLFGLYAKTQGRAVTAVLGVFVAACFLPVVVRFFFYDDWGRNFLYLSPIADILTSEFPRLGVEWGRYSVDPLGHPDPDWTFHPLLHCAFYAVIVGVLVAVNRRLAAGVLLRPDNERASSRLAPRRPQIADPRAAM
jgi:ABC-type transport system involved in multi-copper enzyme maturation permease subunit